MTQTAYPSKNFVAKKKGFEMEVRNIADKFEKWWIAESSPGTFDRKQCWLAFLGGVIVAERQMEPAIVMCSDLIHEVRKIEGDGFCKTCGERL